MPPSRSGLILFCAVMNFANPCFAQSDSTVVPYGPASGFGPSLMACSLLDGDRLSSCCRNLDPKESKEGLVAQLLVMRDLLRGDALIFHNRGNIVAEKLQNERSFAAINCAVALSPSVPALLVARAFNRQTLNDMDGAMADLDAAIRLNGNANDFDIAEAISERASLFSKRQDYSRAISDYREAIRRNPKIEINDERPSYSNPYFSLTRLLSDDAEILDVLNMAVKFNPNEFYAYAWRADFFRAHKRYDEAIRDYNVLIKLQPKNYGAFRNRGTSRLGKGDIDLAIQDFDQAIKLNPDDKSAIKHRAEAIAMKNQLGK